MKKQKKNAVTAENLLIQAQSTLDYYKLIIEEYFTDNVNVNEDLDLLKEKYNLAPEVLREIEQKLVSEKDTKIKLAERANILQTEVFFLRAKLKVSSDIFNTETRIVDPYAIIELVESEMKKLTTKAKKELIQKAIEALGNTSITVDNVKSKIVSKLVSTEDIQRYLKRAEAVKTARAKNSKVS